MYISQDNDMILREIERGGGGRREYYMKMETIEIITILSTIVLFIDIISSRALHRIII